MRATIGSPHKALVRVQGVTLLEWNLRSLLRFGFFDVIVAVSSREPAISDYVRTQLVPIAANYGATVALYEEKTPLGNIGAAREISADNVLVLYVDNLSTIDLGQLVVAHERGSFGATIATHKEPIQIPLGQLSISGNRVIQYVEKPVYHVQVSSGTCVLSRRACSLIPPRRPTGASDLFALLTENGEPVGAFEHDEPWIDINDAGALARAQILATQHSAAFHGVHIA
jgi:NDP-sugar pyrophosphorylase family protein